ncbi:hypothetical protein SAMN04490244_101242 [Tranquillimonas rosea]|uniref:Uncharacterized protein n=1 Tax=Tranquillimonas rosea TaxID=641238 RepID=A0A1H9PL53_9RHOB|nr:hypothetical protein [Tranquillimonas rosea]SER49036.1 hypothetical protein SAMN04490244_101242 [Tranquillimonas rosea]
MDIILNILGAGFAGVIVALIVAIRVSNRYGEARPQDGIGNGLLSLIAGFVAFVAVFVGLLVWG